jgi:hypothetical protein
MDIRPRRGRHAAHQTTTVVIPFISRVAHKVDRRGAPSYQLPARQYPQAWSSPQANYNVLHAFVEGSQPWSREAVRLPRRLTFVLWALIPVELSWGIWLVTVITGASRCDGQICAVATLGNHSEVLLAGAAICIAGLAVLVRGTRGLSRCNDRQVAVVAVALAAGGVALLGIAALIVGVAIGLIVLGAIAAVAVAAFTFAFAETS